MLETVSPTSRAAARPSPSRTAACAAPSRSSFTPRPDGVDVTLSLEYELKERNPLTPLIDLLFIRRAIAASLRRTLERFARERRADVELAAVTSR